MRCRALERVHGMSHEKAGGTTNKTRYESGVPSHRQERSRACRCAPEALRHERWQRRRAERRTRRPEMAQQREQEREAARRLEEEQEAARR